MIYTGKYSPKPVVKGKTIEASTCVCGDDIYYDMAAISMPSFVKSNPGIKLNLFCENPDRMRILMDGIKGNFEILDYYDERDKLPESWRRIAGNVGSNMYALDYNGYVHRQPTVAILPLLSHYRTEADYHIKVDVDTYFVGNMEFELRRIIEAHKGVNPDVYIVSRNFPDIMVMLEGGEDWHGTGFVMWHKDSPFPDKYAEHYTYSLQTTIVQEMYQKGKGELKYCILEIPNLHWVYPFEAFRRQGEVFEKEDCEGYDFLHLHFEGKDIILKQNIVKGWFE